MCTTTLFPSSRNMYSSGLTPSMLRSTHALISSGRKTEIIIWNITQIIQVFIIKVIIDFPKQKNPTHFTTFTTFSPSRLIIRNSKQRNNMGALILYMNDWKVKAKETFFNKRISRIGALFPYRFLSMLIPCDLVFNDNNISSRIASAKYFLCLLKFYIFSVLSPFCVNLNISGQEKKNHQYQLICYYMILSLTNLKPLLYWRIPLICWEQLLMGPFLALNIPTFLDTLQFWLWCLALTLELQFCLHLKHPSRVSYNKITVL